MSMLQKQKRGMCTVKFINVTAESTIFKKWDVMLVHVHVHERDIVIDYNVILKWPLLAVH